MKMMYTLHLLLSKVSHVGNVLLTGICMINSLWTCLHAVTLSLLDSYINSRLLKRPSHVASWGKWSIWRKPDLVKSNWSRSSYMWLRINEVHQGCTQLLCRLFYCKIIVAGTCDWTLVSSCRLSLLDLSPLLRNVFKECPPWWASLLWVYIARIEHQFNLFTRIIFSNRLNLKMDLYLIINLYLFHYQTTL
jgi:hypothetical protein